MVESEKDQRALSRLKVEIKGIEVRSWHAHDGWTIQGIIDGETVLKTKGKVLSRAIDDFRQAHGKAITTGLLKVKA